MEMNEQTISFTIPKMRGDHRRAQIINALEDMFKLLMPTNEIHQVPDDGSLDQFFPFPIAVKTVQKRFAHWTSLDQQDALPAIMITYGDGGSAPDSDVVGYIDEIYPIAVTAVMKESPGPANVPNNLENKLDFQNAAFERNKGRELTDQSSDLHYVLGQLINSNPTLGVEGVNPEKTRIAGWRGSEGTISKFEIIRFRVVVVHRYHANENV